MKVLADFERRQILIGIAAVSTASLTYAAEPRRIIRDISPHHLTHIVPAALGDRVGEDDISVVPESVDASPTTGQIVSRRYADQTGPPIMLVVSYHSAESPELKVHRPETCYAVAGFEVSALHPISLRVTPMGEIPAVAFSARRNDRVEHVIYWTRVGEQFPQSLIRQRLAFLGEALRGIRADGLLVRISVVGEGRERARVLMTQFAHDLVQAAPAVGRLGFSVAR